MPKWERKMQIKKLAKEYGLVAVIVGSFISAFTTLGLNARDITFLKNSNYTRSYTKESTGHLYGYDDNQDGTLDRIERAGLIPFKTGTPAFRIRATYLSTDSEFSWYNERLRSLGTVRASQ